MVLAEQQGTVAGLKIGDVSFGYPVSQKSFHTLYSVLFLLALLWLLVFVDWPVDIFQALKSCD